MQLKTLRINWNQVNAMRRYLWACQFHSFLSPAKIRYGLSCSACALRSQYLKTPWKMHIRVDFALPGQHLHYCHWQTRKDLRVPSPPTYVDKSADANPAEYLMILHFLILTELQNVVSPWKMTQYCRRWVNHIWFYFVWPNLPHFLCSLPFLPSSKMQPCWLCTTW